MTDHYDWYAIIIGAGQSDLTLPFGYPSPKGKGDAPRKNKALAFHEGLY